MNSEMEKYYATNKLFLSGIGGWPYQRKLIKILIPCFFVIVHCITIASQVFLLYDTWGDADTVIECIITVTPVFAANTKLFNIIINNNKFRHLLKLMNKHWELFNNEYEHHILRYYASITQKITNYFAVYCAIALTLYLLIPIIPKMLDIVIPLNESRPLVFVYQAEYRVDKKKYYYPILFHSYLTSIITTLILLTGDTTYIVCVLHGCSLFGAINHGLENITGEGDIKLNNNKQVHADVYYHFEIFIEQHNTVGNDYHELVICLQKHQLALEYVQMVDSTFSHATFVLLFLNMLILSVIGIHLINNLSHTNEIIRYVFLTCGAFVHLTFMCIPGQLLIDQSTEVFDKAYSSAWYTFSDKTKKLLIMLFNRSLVPCTLTAGKFFIMSMSMCSAVMQTAMSYFTTFLSVK